MSIQGSFTDGKLESQKQYLRQRFTDIGCKSEYAIYANYALLQINKYHWNKFIRTYQGEIVSMVNTRVSGFLRCSPGNI